MDKTVFDYKITAEELKCLYISQSSEKEYLENTTAKKRLQDLYVLFKIRNDRTQTAEIGTKLFRKTKIKAA